MQSAMVQVWKCWSGASELGEKEQPSVARYGHANPGLGDASTPTASVSALKIKISQKRGSQVNTVNKPG